MKIAQIAPLYEAIPPRLYGGTERIVSHLTDALVGLGHDVTLFLAGDAVQLLREPVLDSLVGLGTGSLRESYDAIVRSGGRIYVSGNSSKARGFEPNDQAEAALPARLVELALESDRVLTY